MSNETVISGRRFILYGEKDGVMKRLCGSRTFNLNTRKALLKATKPTVSKSKSIYYDEFDYTVSTGGLCSLDTGVNMTQDDLIKMQIEETPLFWVGRSLDHHDIFYAGTALIESVSIDANYDDIMLYSASLSSDGDLITVNPYEIHLIQTGVSDPGAVLGIMDEGKLSVIVKYITGGLPPIN